ncbi:MAG: alkaline phosphatase, partial [Actinomycetota bacterium]|nr:alkaline phosphatase [Actinomycetota bacterium]
MSRDRRRLARATATAVATGGLLASTVGSPASAAPSIDRISLIAIGTYASGVFDGSAAEIVAHDPV